MHDNILPKQNIHVKNTEKEMIEMAKNIPVSFSKLENLYSYLFHTVLKMRKVYHNLQVGVRRNSYHAYSMVYICYFYMYWKTEKVWT